MKRVRTGIYRRVADSGAVTWMVRWWDEAAGKYRILTGGRTKEEAQIFEASLRQELLQNKDPRAFLVKKDSKETVSDLIDKFYRSPRFLGASPTWQREIKYVLDGKVAKALGTLPFESLTKNQLYAFYFKLRKEDQLTNATIQKYHFKLCFLGDIYTEIHPDKFNIPRSMKDFVKLFPNQSSSRPINFLMPDELESLLLEFKKSSSELAYPFITFLAFTGMRRSEALNLKWSDVDHKGGFIHIRRSKNGKSRTIPLEKRASEALDLLECNGEYVFTHKDGKRPYKDIFLRILQRCAKKVGIDKRVDIHTLRHSYGSNKIRSGWGLKKVSLILGHSDISLTAKIYTHLLDGDLKVQDEIRFDNDSPPSNSGESSSSVLNPLDSAVKNMDANSILNMITVLQTQLKLMNPNSAEESNSAPKSAERLPKITPVCYTGATGRKK